MSNYAPDTALYTKTVTVPATTIPITDFPTDPDRTGYNFGSWNTQANGGGSDFTASTAVNGNITVYSQWDTYSYTVTFYSMSGDTEASPMEKTVTSPAVNVDTLPAPPSRSSYIFVGWNTQADGGGSEFTESTAVSGNITVYAKWTGETYTVTFMSNYTPDTVLYTKEVTVPAKTITGFPADPDRTGYNFGGWNTRDDGGGSQFTTSTAVTGNMTVYAQWTGEAYTVTFKSNYDENKTLYTRTVTVPVTTVTDFPANPTRIGYIFAGWNTLANGGGTSFTASTAVNASITVYAQWTGETYTVTFMSNYATDTVLYTKEVTVPATTITGFPSDPSRNGYSFDSWNTQANGGGTPFTASTMVSGNITVYAQWTNTIITLNPEDAGDGAFSQGTFTLSKNGDESQTIAITGSGYTNPRWFVDGELKGTGTGITIQAADYGAGGHKLTLLISKSGVSWSKEISFTVTN
jgi:uncharacterized repeat protein (TIGR02543 family)